MVWRERIQNICTDCQYGAPAETIDLSDVEVALTVSVPEELRDLWLEANGIVDRYGSGVWSTGQVIEQNLEMRSYPEQNDLYMTFDSMFCFADAGNGDLFFFPIQGDGKIHRLDVFVWKHETDSREWVAENLPRFVDLWFGGQLFIEIPKL